MQYAGTLHISPSVEYVPVINQTIMVIEADSSAAGGGRALFGHLLVSSRSCYTTTRPVLPASCAVPCGVRGPTLSPMRNRVYCEAGEWISWAPHASDTIVGVSAIHCTHTGHCSPKILQ